MPTQSGRRLQPYLYLVTAVTLLSSITPALKYLFQQSDLPPIGTACVRVAIGFVLLFIITLLKERRELCALGPRNVLELGLIGLLGVFSYSVAAWGLRYTTVTHYILIYGLLPSFTAVLSFLMGKEDVRPMKVAGIVISLVGCSMSVSDGFSPDLATFGMGDGLILLFTLAMAAYIVLSSGIVKRIGVMTSNMVMFGTSAVLLLVWSVAWEDAPQEPLTLSVATWLIYIGGATAAVFFRRCLSLRTLTPLTVGVFHNLVPICAMVLAYIFLNESIAVHSIVGAAVILAGTECVRRGNRDNLASLAAKAAFIPIGGRAPEHIN